VKIDEFKRKAKYAIFIPRKVTRRPNNESSVISDLFLIRAENDWQTFFEVLNIPALLNGKYSEDSKHQILFVFFDQNGVEVGRKNIVSPTEARHSLALTSDFFPGIERASTFCLFHHGYLLDDNLSGSYLAERGYVGYQRIGLPMRGYVHGNLDSIAFYEKGLQLLGNAGILRRSYQVQHPLRGFATYEMFLTNPCNSKVKIKVQLRSKSTSWRKYQIFTLNPRGSRKISISVKETEVKFVRIVSRLYLGRPVVFRNTSLSFDVFHG
jgi:hypothetical protein